MHAHALRVMKQAVSIHDTVKQHAAKERRIEIALMQTINKDMQNLGMYRAHEQHQFMCLQRTEVAQGALLHRLSAVQAHSALKCVNRGTKLIGLES